MRTQESRLTGVTGSTLLGCLEVRVPLREQICRKQQVTHHLMRTEPMWQGCWQVSKTA